MNKLTVSILILSLLVGVNTLNTPFEKVVVLVMENHSYDNMLGYMDAPIGTLKETPFCNDLNGKTYCTSPGADYETHPDPPHTYQDINEQLFKLRDLPGKVTEVPSMGGFAQNYSGAGGDPQTAFDCYTKEQVPIISTLAEEFTIFDNWYCGAPTSTDPNRYFVHACSSEGYLINQQPVELNTIFNQLADEEFSWEIHWQDWCPAMYISPLNENKEQFIWDEQFYYFNQQLQNGTLADYTFLLPRIMDDTYDDPETGETVFKKANTQHPSEDIREGEQLIKEVYENLRNSPYWDNTLLFITYDEHGGFPDHVAPPSGVSNPEGVPGQYDFEFNRLGPRVPSIAISPWLKKTVDHTQLEHPSIAKTIREVFNMKSPYLNIREEESNIFLNDDILLSEKRTDCPTTLPDVPFGQDHLYTLKPSNHIDRSNLLEGIPEAGMQGIGLQLVQQGVLNPLKFKQITSQIKNNKEAMQFVKEAQVLLGFRPLESIKGFQYLHENMLIQKK